MPTGVYVRTIEVSAETRAKLSEINMGHPVSLETRAKISAARVGRQVSPETRAKISAAGMGNRNGLGHHCSEEARAGMSAARVGYVTSPETKVKLSIAMKGRPSPNKGKPMSENTRAAIFGVEARAKSAASHWRGGGLASWKKHTAKRRALGWNTLNSWFEGSDGHHINKTDVIYIPAAMHNSIRHNIWTGKNMEKINAMACQWFGKMSEGEVLQ